ncbi:winged helix-turn-helix domain-containing protein [Caulobacter sp. RL271]|uniref:Winged helix-turn-helix domain-containing protein n=1 Tax=Caulobacter segnis TaxID=88688 RepID=A0ABY4ZNU0_9CAUL|nr:winged helix-turn-helix domain-containing protein [Caulobacter segnis]USQ94335.1 winged helix-turn-helix domain-containing protein [Caulobacter segnis]
MAFGDVSIDVESRRVRAPIGASHLEPRTFDLLLTLTERPGLTASRDYLIETLWTGVRGADETLSQAVADLRRALGDDARAPRFIETVPELGYRWIFEEPPGRLPPTLRWLQGPAWVAAGAVLAIAVGGVGGVGAYAWVRGAEPNGFEIRKTRMQRMADGHCRPQVQIIRGRGFPSTKQHAPPTPSSPGCAQATVARAFVQL